MAKEFSIPGLPSGTHYGVILNSAGQLWYTVTPVFEARNAAHWTSYALTPDTSDSTPFTSWDMPAGITTPGNYTLVTFKQAGGSPATTDKMSGFCDLAWLGTVEEDEPSLVELHSGYQRFTAHALELAPTGGGGGVSFVVTYAIEDVPPYSYAVEP